MLKIIHVHRSTGTSYNYHIKFNFERNKYIFKFICGFSLAADFALNLFDVDMEEYSKCTVPSGDLLIESKPWIYDEFTLRRVIGILQKQWTHFNVK